MESSTDEPHPNYLKGFNQGYMITKHMPDLADQLGSAKGNSLYLNGFHDGKEQHVAEMKKHRRPAWLGEDRLASLEHEKDLDKDRDKDEIDLERE